MDGAVQDELIDLAHMRFCKNVFDCLNVLKGLDLGGRIAGIAAFELIWSRERTLWKQDECINFNFECAFAFTLKVHHSLI